MGCPRPRIWRELGAGERTWRSSEAGLHRAGCWALGPLMSGFFGLAGAGGVSLLGAIALVVVVYLKHAPKTSITWSRRPIR